MGFVRYVAKRLLSFAIVLFTGLTITFFLPRMMPGNPIDNYIGQMQSRAGQTLSPQAVQELRDSLEKLYGLQAPCGSST
ncbi:MAG: hypothetical protein LCH96_09410 [Actinobacteria bacterium]|nr:hypothetical protein [Actinomycetota bacterium]